jgi:hypothetical protein
MGAMDGSQPPSISASTQALPHTGQKLIAPAGRHMEGTSGDAFSLNSSIVHVLVLILL